MGLRRKCTLTYLSFQISLLQSLNPKTQPISGLCFCSLGIGAVAYLGLKMFKNVPGPSKYPELGLPGP